MDHHFRVGAEGPRRGARTIKYYFGNRPTGFYIPRFRNLLGDKREYLRGFGYQGSASRAGLAARGARARHRRRRSRTARRSRARGRSAAMAFGEMLPHHENQVTLDETKKDKWGLPVLEIDCATGENERLMRKDMKNDMAEMLEAAGVKNVTTYDSGYFPGMGIHEMGTARMGTRPEDVGAQRAGTRCGTRRTCS